MDIQKTIDFVFKDEKWFIKCLIAAGLMITGIGAIPVYGWMMACIRCASSDEECSLPEWDDFGRYIIDGLKYLGLGLVWGLPMVLLITITAVIVVFASISLPEEQAGLMGFIMFPVYSIAFLYMIPVTLLSMPAYTLLANGDSFGYVLNPVHSWRLFKADFGSFLIAMALLMFGGYLLNMVGMLLCFVGIFFTSALLQPLLGHMLGQAYKNAQAKMEASAIEA